MKTDPGYYAVIPADVRYDKRLPMAARLLYGELTALCNKTGVCWAGNAYFARLYDVSERTVTNWINAMRDSGYIDVSFKYVPGKKEVESRIIKIADSAIRAAVKAATPSPERDPPEVVKKFSPPMAVKGLE
jgi:hypothetical protein